MLHELDRLGAQREYRARQRRERQPSRPCVDFLKLRHGEPARLGQPFVGNVTLGRIGFEAGAEFGTAGRTGDGIPVHVKASSPCEAPSLLAGTFVAMPSTEPIVEKRTEIVFPTDVNHYGTLFGGKAVAMMDVVASIAAMRAAHKPVVTASIDRIDFKEPIRQGNLVETIARVVAIGRTSITVEVELWRVLADSGERVLSTVGKFVMVAIDRDGKPTPVNPT